MQRTFVRTLISLTTPIALVAMVFSLAGCATIDSTPAPEVAAKIVQSPNDTRHYQFLTLDNALRVIIISDPHTDKAAAALNVGVGSLHDPIGREGLAHFLEHMLFLGTEEFPSSGEYQEFINTHGGNHNAYTAAEDTNYFFDIDKDHLESALARFSQFFVAPLFNEEYVAREKKAVHSEYQARLKDDMRRTYSVFQQLTNPAHPASRFNVGSLDTLADRGTDTVHQELLKFYEKFYSSELMTLVILGKEPLPTLESWARAKFGAIAQRPVAIPSLTAPLFVPTQLPARANIIPITDQRTLMLTFALPPVHEHVLTAPVSYIANLVGHEGQGSLLSSLKRTGWADSLSAGLGMDNRDNAALSISLGLTLDGLEQIDAIVARVFSYLRLIDAEGVQKWRFDEQRRLNEIGFRFVQKSAAARYTSSIAGDMRRFPAHNVLRGRYFQPNYDGKLIHQFLRMLTPDNVLITMIAKGVETDQIDPWYGADYAIHSIAPEKIATWRDPGTGIGLKLPEPNVFIPNELTINLAPDPQPAPIQLAAEPGYELWHKDDTDFEQPRADFFFSIRSPHANDNPRNTVLTNLFVRVVNDNLTEFSYPALLAGLNYQLYTHIRGFSVRLSGFDEQQDKLLNKVIVALRQPNVDPDRFSALKDDLARSLRNSKDAPPYNQAMQEIRNLLVKPYWTVDQRLDALSLIDRDDLVAFMPKLLSKVYLVALSHGNARSGDSRAMIDVIREQLLTDTTPAQVAPARVVRLSTEQPRLRELGVKHPDSVLAVYYQGQDKTTRTRALYDLLGQILSSAFFNDLRTDKQLGYIVHAGASPLIGVPGLVGLVQSPGTDPASLLNHIDNFMSHFHEQMTTLEQATFSEHKQGLISRFTKADQRLSTRSDRYWSELDLQHYSFDTREAIVRELQTIGIEEFRHFVKRSLLERQNQRLLVISTGDNHAGTAAPTDTAAIVDLEQFRAGAQVFPDGPAANPQVLTQ